MTVGDTTKMYYWTGADWEELPIVNDVEAFKEQIADELKDVPNREEFEATITENLLLQKLKLKHRLTQLKHRQNQMLKPTLMKSTRQQQKSQNKRIQLPTV